MFSLYKTRGAVYRVKRDTTFSTHATGRLSMEHELRSNAKNNDNTSVLMVNSICYELLSFDSNFVSAKKLRFFADS